MSQETVNLRDLLIDVFNFQAITACWLLALLGECGGLRVEAERHLAGSSTVGLLGPRLPGTSSGRVPIGAILAVPAVLVITTRTVLDAREFTPEPVLVIEPFGIQRVTQELLEANYCVTAGLTGVAFFDDKTVRDLDR